MSKSKKTAGADDYFALVHDFPLRPLRDEEEYNRSLAIFKDLISRADSGLSEGESDYADALSHFIGIYENSHYAMKDAATPIDRLRFLMEQNEMNTSDLGKLLGSGQGQASLILNGKRELSKANIRILSQRFNVSPALLL